MMSDDPRTPLELVIVPAEADPTTPPAWAASALPNHPTRAQIDLLEAHMRQLPPIELEPVHHFAAGLYARELRIPAGTLLTGKVHKTEHLNILSAGTITVWTEEGMRTLSAPFTLVSQPGTKRVGYAHSDCVWTTVHATDETDLERLEAELVETEALTHSKPASREPEKLSCHGSQ
jgi:hypothetical protein